MEKDKIIDIVEHINVLLVSKNYYRIHEEDARKLVTVEEIRDAILEYGGEVTKPEIESDQRIIIIPIKNSMEVHVDFDLWFDNECSDLTVSCVMGENDNGDTYYAIEGIHIL